MSWSDEEIDKLFQSQADTPVFEYKDEYWKEVEAMLPEKRKPDGLWFILSTICAGALIVGMFYPSNSIMENNQRIADIGAETIENTISEKSLASNNDVDKIDADSEMNEIAFGGNLTESTKDVTIAKIGAANNSIINEPTTTTIINNNTTIDQFSIVSITEDEQNVVPSIEATQTKAIEFENIPSVLARPFSLQSTVYPYDFHESKMVMPLPHGWTKQLYVQAFGGVGSSYLAKSNSVISNAGLGIGLQLGRGDFSTSIELNGSVSSLNDLTYSKEVREYGFGMYLRNYNVAYKQIGSLGLRWSLNYHVNRSSFGFGVQPTYMFGSRVMLTKNNVEYVASFQQETIEDREVYYGFYEGLNRFGLATDINYAYRLNSKWELGASFGVQWINRVNETMGDTPRILPIEARFSIKRNLNFK